MSTSTDREKKIISDIKEFGWHVIKVLEDDRGPGFGYSIGLFETFGHPEIIIVGLKPDLIHTVINNIGEDIRKGKTFSPLTYQSDLIEGFDCYFIQVNPEFYEEYAGQALWYYDTNKIPILQCIYPTVKGIYPWQQEWPESIRDLQPILGEIKIMR